MHHGHWVVFHLGMAEFDIVPGLDELSNVNVMGGLECLGVLQHEERCFVFSISMNDHSTTYHLQSL